MKKLIALVALLAVLVMPSAALAQSYDGSTVESESDGVTYNVSATSGDSVTLNNLGDTTGDLTVEFANGVTGSIVATQSATRPADAPSDPEGIISVYFDIDLVGMTNDDITSATWRFTVDQSWLSDNGVTADNVFLQHYNGSSWERLPTNVVSEDATTATLEATITSFSPFAVTAVAGLSNTGSGAYLTIAVGVALLAAAGTTYQLSRKSR